MSSGRESSGNLHEVPHAEAGLECLVVLSEWTKDGDFRTARKVLRDISEVPAEVVAITNQRMNSPFP